MTGSTIEEFLGGYQPPRISVDITARADLLAEHQAATRSLRVSIRDDLSGGATSEIEDRIAVIETQIAESSRTFTFQALGRQEYSKLLANHPPTPDDRKAGIGFSSETFPVALIAASAVDPTLGETDSAALAERLSDGQFSKLWNAAIGVNIGDDVAPKSVRRSATADRSATSSSTADDTASPDPSSLAG